MSNVAIKWVMCAAGSAFVALGHPAPAATTTWNTTTLETTGEKYVLPSLIHAEVETESDNHLAPLYLATECSDVKVPDMTEYVMNGKPVQTGAYGAIRWEVSGRGGKGGVTGVDQNGSIHFGTYPTRIPDIQKRYRNHVYVYGGSWTTGCRKKYVHYYLGWENKTADSYLVYWTTKGLGVSADKYFVKVGTATAVNKHSLRVEYVDSVSVNQPGKVVDIVKTGSPPYVNSARLWVRPDDTISPLIAVLKNGAPMRAGEVVSIDTGTTISVKTTTPGPKGVTRGNITVQVSVR